jgi:hypothetical protein
MKVRGRGWAGAGRLSRGRIDMAEPLPLPSYRTLHGRFEEKEEGILYHKKSVANDYKRIGTIAGSKNEAGYQRVMIGGQRYFRSRLIWKMHYGTDPKGQIDHINGNRADDKISNLRDVPLGINARNKNHHNGECNLVSREEVIGRYVYKVISFSLGLWPDEDAETIRWELHNATAHILDRIYKNRKGRKRPPSEKV